MSEAIVDRNSIESPETEMDGTTLSLGVIEFLCRVGGSLRRRVDETSISDETSTEDWIGQSEGLVGLTCPVGEEVEGEDKGVVKNQGNHKIEILCRVPFIEIVSASKPGVAVIEAIHRIINTHSSLTPCFLFVRRTIPSNTPKWVFVSWVPDKYLDSNYTMFQIAQIRNAILTKLPSVHNIVASLCRTIADLGRLRPLLTCDSSDPIVESLIGSRTAESFCRGIAELSVPRTPLERLSLLNSFKSIDDFQTHQPYLKNLPIRLSNACKDTLQQLAKGDCDGVILRVDDTTSIVQSDGTLRFQLPSDLISSFDVEEPKYYLVFWNERYYFILHIPEKRNMALRFLYTLFKTTIKNQVEDFLGIEIVKSVDVRQGESIAFIFQDDRITATDVSEQMLLMSEISVRPRPPVTRMGLDPFLLVKSVMKPDGKVEYVTVGAHERFRF